MNTGKRIIAVNSNCYHGYSIEDALEGIHAAGFHYVELTATKGWTEHVFPTQSFAYLQGLKKKMGELDIKPFSMSGHCNLMDEERLPDFIQNIELAHFFGCDYIVSSVGEAHLKDRQTTGNQVLCEHLRSLLPYLEKYQMTLVLEIHGDHCTGKILKEITDTVASKWVKINYDTANAIFYGGVIPEEDMDNCGEDLVYIHLKDKAGEQKEWNFPALGEGYVNFPAIFKKLEEKQNLCPFSIEIEFTPEGAGSLENVNKAVKTSADYLISHGFVL